MKQEINAVIINNKDDVSTVTKDLKYREKSRSTYIWGKYRKSN